MRQPARGNLQVPRRQEARAGGNAVRGLHGSYAGIVTEKMSMRKGRMLSYTCHAGARVRLEFSVPSRALIGYRDSFLTDTKGTGIMNSYILRL
jgi:predicted membrane GTPase involved in stress response